MHNHSHTPKHAFNTYMCCNKHIMESYSWLFGCLEGITVGLVYEMLYCKCCAGFDIKEAEHGFKFGLSETVWCCGLL